MMLVHPSTKKEVKGVEGVNDTVVFSKERADSLLNVKGCFKSFIESFEYTNYFNNYLFQDTESTISIKEANMVVDGFGWQGSYEVGEFDVLTENVISMNLKETEKLNKDMVYNPKVRHRKVRGIKLVIPMNGGKVFKEIFVPYKVKEISNSKKINGFVLYFNECGERNLFSVRKNTKTDNLIDAAITCVVLYCEIQKQSLRKKERIKREVTLPKRKKSSDKPIKNVDGTYTVNLDKGIQFIYEKSDVHIDFVRHCEAWNVRGHYRHYKSGKVGFVKPYVKGKGRLNSKTYMV